VNAMALRLEENSLNAAVAAIGDIVRKTL